MNIVSFGCRNFMGHKNTTIDLDANEPRFIEIRGNNYDFASEGSNAAGKSTIMEIISVALTGKTIREVDAVDDIVRENSKGGTTVWAKARTTEGLLHVKRYRNHPKYKNKVRAWLNGKDVVRGRTVAETEKRLRSILGFDHDVFMRTVVLHGRKTTSLSTAKDAFLKSLTERLVGMPEFDPVQKIVREHIKESSSEIARIDQRIIDYNTLIDDAQSKLKSTQRKHDEYADTVEKKRADLRAKIEKLGRDRNEKFKEIEKLSKIAKPSKMDNQDEYESKLESIDEEIQDIISKKARVERDIEVEGAALRRYDKLLNKKSGVCPECGQSIDSKHIKIEKKRHSEAVEELTTEQDKIESALKHARVMRKGIKSQLSLIAEQYEQKEREYWKAQQSIKSLEKLQASIEEEIAYKLDELENVGENPYIDIINGLERDIKAHDKRIKKLEDKKKGITNNVEVYEFWRWGFGPNGLRSFILDGVTPILNHNANIYLDYLTDSQLQVTLNTVSLAKDGTYKDRFDIEVHNATGASKLKSDSDGEIGCVDIAVHFAMSDILASRIGLGLLMIDQFLDTVDLVRARKAIRLLRLKQDENWCANNNVPQLWTILLITHKTGLHGMVQDIINVEKRNAISEVITNAN